MKDNVYILWLFLAIFASHVSADNLANIADIFPQKHRIIFTEEAIDNHRIYLSGIKKVNGRWRAGEYASIKGPKFIRTVEFSDALTHVLYAHINAYAAQQAFQSIFACRGLVFPDRTCGWAKSKEQPGRAELGEGRAGRARARWACRTTA